MEHEPQTDDRGPTDEGQTAEVATPESSAELDELRREIEELKTALSEYKARERRGDTSRPPAIDAGAGSANRPEPLTADSLKRMKPSEIARLDWAEVRAVLARG